MRQQINLYQPIFSEERKPFSAFTVAIGFGVVGIALVAFSVHAHLQVAQMERQVEQLRAQLTQQEALVEQAAALKAEHAQADDIEARIKQLTRSISDRTRALQMLQSGAAGQTTGFATRLEALARRHVRGLWLDSVVLSGTNGSMSLGGATLDPDIVPLYLKNLARETVLTGTRFDEFSIENPVKVVKSETADADPAAPEHKPTQKHLRFRAGSKALAPAATEAST